MLAIGTFWSAKSTQKLTTLHSAFERNVPKAEVAGVPLLVTFRASEK
jgi:hypothetical protein